MRTSSFWPFRVTVTGAKGGILISLIDSAVPSWGRQPVNVSAWRVLLPSSFRSLLMWLQWVITLRTVSNLSIMSSYLYTVATLHTLTFTLMALRMSLSVCLSFCIWWSGRDARVWLGSLCPYGNDSLCGGRNRAKKKRDSTGKVDLFFTCTL